MSLRVLIAMPLLLSLTIALGACAEGAPGADSSESETSETSAGDPAAGASDRDLSMSDSELSVDLEDDPIRTFEAQVVESAPPVRIEVHREGEGEACPDDAVAHIAFVARLADGEEWDSSVRRRYTLAVPLDGYATIPGLRASITGMQPGEVRRTVIPWQLAYGEQGRSPIPPETDLIFEIRLVRFEPGSESPE